jgi:alkylation response protein AidB-like acyl-CoA dehydrogenase
MNEIQKEIVSQLKKFRMNNIEPFMEEDDRDEMFRMDIYQKIGELGFAGITVPEEFGGAGMSLTDQCIAFMEIAKSSVPYAVTLSVSAMVQNILKEWGNQKQKEKYLPPLASGQAIGSFALSESSSGSDAVSLKTTAKKTDGGYKLLYDKGTKPSDIKNGSMG